MILIFICICFCNRTIYTNVRRFERKQVPLYIVLQKYDFLI